MVNNWTITLETGSTITRDFADTECPYPWGPGLAIMDPAVGMPSSIYNATGVREVRLTTMPTSGGAGTYKYTLTRVSPDPALDIFTSDDRGLEMYGDGFYAITRPITGSPGKRFVILIVRWNRIVSIVRALL